MENIKYDVNQEPIVTSKVTFDILLKQENPSDLIALYHFYYYTAKWQQTNQVRAVTNYTAKGLKWTEQRVRKNKKILAELGFIEDYEKRDPITKAILGHYIKVNFIWSYPEKKTHKWETHPVEEATVWDRPQCSEGHSVADRGTNALRKTNKGNTLRGTNNKNALGNTIKRKRLNNIVPPSDEGETVSNNKNEIYLPIAKKLADLITSKKRVKINGHKLNGWANSIRLMVTADGIKPTRIHDALDWYTEHSEDDYVPVIESGSSLRQKFIKLENAIERDKNPKTEFKTKSGYKKGKLKYKKAEKL